jgi:3,4-dihydroxy 2-butanone 4-phosphate synthase/GTP cyclohydrolase II
LIEEVAAGRTIVLLDDLRRGGEGALVFPADGVNARSITLMALKARGLVCLAITAGRALQLGLMLQPRRGEQRLDSSFTMSIEARHGVTTGISAADRAATIAAAVAADADAASISSPGHIFPVVAADGGILERPGFAEAAIDLMRLAGRSPTAVFCRVLRDDGRMADTASLLALAQEHDLCLGSIGEMVALRAASQASATLVRFRTPEAIAG